MNPQRRSRDLLEDMQRRAAQVQERRKAGGVDPEVEALWEEIGPDPLGLLDAPPPPSFLKGHDQKLPANKVASFLRTLSMTEDRVDDDVLAERLKVENLAVGQTVSTERSGPDMFSLGGETLPDTGATVEMPLVMSSAWFGRALTDEVAPRFRQRVADAAVRYHGQIDFVVFTDISRELFDAVRNGVPEDHATQPELAHVPKSELERIRQMLEWAKGDGSYRVHLVNLFEVFNAENPMPFGLGALVQSNLNKADGPGYAEASDIVRWVIPWWSGVSYSDGDNVIYDDLIPEMQDTLDSEYGFTMGGSWQGNVQQHGGAGAGRESLADVGVEADPHDLRRATVRFHGPERLAEGLPSRAGESEAALGGAARRTDADRDRAGVPPPRNCADLEGDLYRRREVLARRPHGALRVDRPRTARVAATLVRELYNREGMLHLPRSHGVLAAEAEQQAMWKAVLGFLAERPEIASKVVEASDGWVDPNDESEDPQYLDIPDPAVLGTI